MLTSQVSVSAVGTLNSDSNQWTTCCLATAPNSQCWSTHPDEAQFWEISSLGLHQRISPQPKHFLTCCGQMGASLKLPPKGSRDSYCVVPNSFEDFLVNFLNRCFDVRYLPFATIFEPLEQLFQWVGWFFRASNCTKTGKFFVTICSCCRERLLSSPSKIDSNVCGQQSSWQFVSWRCVAQIANLTSNDFGQVVSAVANFKVSSKSRELRFIDPNTHFRGDLFRLILSGSWMDLVHPCFGFQVVIRIADLLLKHYLLEFTISEPTYSASSFLWLISEIQQEPLLLLFKCLHLRLLSVDLSSFGLLSAFRPLNVRFWLLQAPQTL